MTDPWAAEGLSVPAGGLARAAAREGERVAKRGRIREVVFGAQDGLLSTLALVTGVRGAEATRYTILVAGLSGALAGTISMALGAYVAAKSQRDVFRAELENERRQLERRPHVELVELADIFQAEGLAPEAAQRAAEAIATNPETMLKTMAEKELGIPYEAPGSPGNDAVTMGTSFVMGASVPILPYLFLAPTAGLAVSVLLTLGTLFVMGVVKARLAGERWARSGAEIAGLAGAAAALAYVVGTVLPRALGIHPPAG
ncbi:MAG TPA: VIT1/CCC1 transporter family protein [Mycobacteriales bacterium]|nr:VIT1/CCC1 transporter family protein [Mycobacteriales bacterium]